MLALYNVRDHSGESSRGNIIRQRYLVSRHAVSGIVRLVELLYTASLRHRAPLGSPDRATVVPFTSLHAFTGAPHNHFLDVTRKRSKGFTYRAGSSGLSQQVYRAVQRHIRVA